MGSTRLPGKVVADLGGLPVLALVLRRLRRVPSEVIRDVVVATSTDPRDDTVETLASSEGFAVVRGSEADVLSRFGAALDAYPADHLVRITADCPFTDPGLVTTCVRTAEATGASYTSNTLLRTFPDGLDVEVVTATALHTAMEEAADPLEREHVTPFVYRDPERFALQTVANDEFLGAERWTLDTEADLGRLRMIAGGLSDPVGATWRDVLGVAGRMASPRSGELWLRPNVDRPLREGRRWSAVRDEETLGTVTVRSVGGGRGRLQMDGVPAALQPEVRELLDRALAADLQIRTLVYDVP